MGFSASVAGNGFLQILEEMPYLIVYRCHDAPLRSVGYALA